MVKSKIIDIIKLLDAEEFKALGKFISSPFFNDNKTLVKMYYFLKKYFPDFKNKNFTREKAYASLYPGKIYNDGTMRKLLSVMGELAEEFLGQLNYRKNPLDKVNYLLKEAYKRNLGKIFDVNLSYAKNILEHNKFKPNERYLHNYNLHGLIENNLVLKSGNRIVFYDAPIIENRLSQHEDLIMFFILEMLEIYNYLLSNKTMLDVKAKLKFLPQVEKYLEDNPPVINSRVWVKYDILKMLLDKISENEFVKLKDFEISEYSKNGIEENEFYGICIHLLNYCQFRDSKGDTNFSVYAFDISKKMYDNDINGNSPYYSFILFKNILVIAFRQGEFDWAEEYFNKYIDKVDAVWRNSGELFYKAILSFEKGDFEKSQEYFSKLKFEDVYNKNYIKHYMIMNNYELKEYNSVLEIIDSHKHFISHNKDFPNDYKVKTIKFIDFVNSLVKLNYSGNKTGIETLKNNILADDITLSKQWLLRKVEELEKL